MDEIFIDEMSNKDVLNTDFFQWLYKDNSFDLCFYYSSNFSNTKFLRDSIKIIFEILWLDNIWVNRFILISDELNNNAIEYWSKENSLNKMYIKASNNWENIDIILEITDSWDWDLHKNSIEMNALRIERLEKWFDNHNSIRWRGLFLIITKLVDELYFKDSQAWGLVVWINKKIQQKKDV